MTTKELYHRIWRLSPGVDRESAYGTLTDLTKELAGRYDQQGRLDIDPFAPTRARLLTLPYEEINNELKDSVCIVTGGLGCVGSELVDQLKKFDVKKIVILDKQKTPLDLDENDWRTSALSLINIHCDIRDLQKLKSVFSHFYPDFVFHTAAERNPGFAESHVLETVSTNITGTLNVVNACEDIGTVKQMVFSSTGKASRYFTEEVYAATKKVCEFILSTYSMKSNVKYSVVRFTHILDNSLMNIELEEKSKNNRFLSVHSPGKYVTAQTALEAGQLMLNAIICSKEKQCKMLLVRHLEWPVESLEVALYYIRRSERNIPVTFMGNPLGYSEKFFRGQLDWSTPDDLNLLLNVYEGRYKEFNATGEIIISRIVGIPHYVLNNVLRKLEYLTDEDQVRKALISGLHAMVEEYLRYVDQETTRNILRWGLEPRHLEIENLQPTDFGAIIPLMVDSLNGSKYFNEVDELISHKV